MDEQIYDGQLNALTEHDPHFNHLLPNDFVRYQRAGNNGETLDGIHEVDEIFTLLLVAMMLDRYAFAVKVNCFDESV